ncbi:hypothetical protein [Azospirillum soli]|uniref:hypothetical protein n=1 Tax=Azospirillum soli TaxID=1304799 RepID=UPI001AE3D99E|nr:hypothetical protein [Azospirillum soli]MBP2312989.1 hypothetical protein [Azospirillum soli]
MTETVTPAAPSFPSINLPASMSIVPATAEHAAHLAPRLRKADVEEIAASSGRTPIESLQCSVASSAESYAVISDGQPIAIFGVVSIVDGVGFPWLMGSDELSQYPEAFIKSCMPVIEFFHGRFPVLTGMIDARNTLHLRWLEWCGFELVQRHPDFGVGGVDFWQFRRVHHV